MPENQTTKECTKCGEPYPATTEYFTKKGKGLHSWCRNCTRAWNREYKRKNKEAIAAAEKARYDKNVDNIREKKRIANIARYRRVKKEHGEQIREYKKNWQKNKREKTKEVKTRALESDDYTDLVPLADRDTFREWAVITSGEYGYILQKGVDSVAGDDVE